MRILHVVGGLNRGGAETWLVQILRHVDRRKYQMDFLVHSEQPGAYDEEVKALGARVLPCLSPSNPIRYSINFRRILRQYGPYDCVHSHVHWYSGFVLFLAAKNQVPLRIVHGHTDTRTLDCASSPLRKAYLRTMAKLIHRYATAGIAVSENAAASQFSDSWRSDPRWNLCPLGIDVSPFQEEVDARAVRAELGLPPGASVIGHVGRFVEAKNHQFLVEIAERLCREEPSAVFLLVGDGPLRPEIEARVRAKRLWDRFFFVGIRADVPRIMKGAMDCFLFPSLYEGLSMALLEAQAAGLPCVISDRVPAEGSAVEQLIGRLSLTESPETWARASIEAARASRNVSRTLPPELAGCTIGTSAARVESAYCEATLRRT